MSLVVAGARCTCGAYWEGEDGPERAAAHRERACDGGWTAEFAIIQPATIVQEPTKDPDPNSPSPVGVAAATDAVGDADGAPLIDSEADRANRMQEPAPKWTGARDVDGELWRRRQPGHDWWTCVDRPVVQGTGGWLWGWYGPLTDASDEVPVGETPERPKCHEPAPDRPWTLRDGFGAENRPANDD